MTAARRAALVLAAAVFATAAPAREQNDAPYVEVIGFSADGRYFAWEEYTYEMVSDVLVAAIHVVDRQTNAPAPGFPFGAVPETRDGDYPALVGGFTPDPVMLEPDGNIAALDALREALRDAAKPRLDALGIAKPGRRIAGVPMTQRSPAESRTTPLTFVLRPTIPGPVPDQQLSYTVDARRDAEMPDCVNADPPRRTKGVTFDVIATQTWPEVKDVGRAQSRHSFEIEPGECDLGLWLSDIILPPGEDRSRVAVLYLTSQWGSFTESARWHGAFVTLPVDPR